VKPPVMKFSRWAGWLWPGRPEPAKSWQIARRRLAVATVLAGICFAGISAQALNLALLPNDGAAPANTQQAGLPRGVITDRQGRLLASNLPVRVLHADPQLILDRLEVAEKLAPLLPGQEPADILALLAKPTRYIELDRKITPRRHAEILRLGLPGVFVSPGTLRLYPHGREAAHLLGVVDRDGLGIAGIEKSQQDKLARGQPVTLSIDLALQAILREQVGRQIERFEAIGGAGLILDMKSGELLALASLPDFDPNHLMAAEEKARFNQAAKGVFEMGSIFKVLNTAIALESGAARLDSQFEVARPMRVSRFAIRDYHPLKGPLSVPEILVHSSNIGSARMADLIGPDTQRAYLDRLGLLRASALEIPENGQPLLPPRWGRIASLTISYGHGLSVSPVQAAAAIAAAAGDGHYIKPTLLKRHPQEEIERVRIFSEETARAVRSMMRLVVSHKAGTGNLAEVEGYLIGGKTGTAEKILNKGYDRKANRVSFVATFPAHDPAYLVFIMVDEPKGQKHSYGYATAGWVAAPAAGRIIRQMAPIVGIHPVATDQPEIRQNLLAGLSIDGEEAIYAAY